MKFNKFFLYFFLFFVTFIFFIEFISYNFLHGSLYEIINDVKFIQSHNVSIFLPKYDGKELERVHNIIVTRHDDELPFSSEKSSILLLGCSYTYGHGIHLSKNFSSQLQKYTNRKVYNISYMGGGFDEMFEMQKDLSVSGFYKNMIEPEYVIYTLMANHIKRFTSNNISSYLLEKSLENKDNSFLDKLKFYLLKLATVRLFVVREFSKDEINNIVPYQKWIFNKMYLKVKDNFPNSKFIFLIYQDLKNVETEMFSEIEYETLKPAFWSDLDKNISIITTEELVGDSIKNDEYKLSFDEFQTPAHPNEKAWELIVPALVKKLQL